jgi:hypothetical protein
MLKNLWILLLVLPLTGCVTLGHYDTSLNLDISPIPVYRGKPALAKINAPMDAKEVVGTVLVMGSPQLVFRKDVDKEIWYFFGTIPFSPWVTPGTYKVRVTAYPQKGEPQYTEMKVELK